jgi:hypothetical protein
MNGYDRYERRARVATFGVAFAAAIIAIVMNGMQGEAGQQLPSGSSGIPKSTTVVSGQTGKPQPPAADPSAVSFG